MGAGECKVSRDMSDKVVVITGANAGIGRETVRHLASIGATIVLATRSMERTKPLLDELLAKYDEKKIVHIPLDLSDLESVKSFAEQFKAKFDKLDVLLNNAGIMANVKKEVTKQGFEAQFGTNHLGHFLLTNLLLDSLKKAEKPRVISISSLMSENCFGKSVKIDFDDLMYEKHTYAEWMAYSRSKLANVMMTKELQRRMRAEGVDMKCVSIHPGVVKTELGNQGSAGTKFMLTMSQVIAKTPKQGAQTSLYCILEDFDKLVDGGYYADCKIRKENKFSLNEENNKKLWEVSEKLVGI